MGKWENGKMREWESWRVGELEGGRVGVWGSGRWEKFEDLKMRRTLLNIHE
jgi:hypothetical protein